ncbi:MAG: GNAT family N-acetyltransferase [Bacteroidota bacterium]
MYLRPVDTNDVRTISQWLAEKENYQWLDFGSGKQILSPESIKIMIQRDIHVLRLVISGPENIPVGLVALSNIDRNFGTATLWAVLGDKRYSGHGYTTRAISEMLTYGFDELGLQSINAWSVESNTASIRLTEKNHFRVIGKQRRCHRIDGQMYDRLLFDILASEHRGELREQESPNVSLRENQSSEFDAKEH